MICPYIVNVSVLLGGILSWGVMWPLIAKKKGSWYLASVDDSSLHGLQAYMVNIDPTYGCPLLFSQSQYHSASSHENIISFVAKNSTASSLRLQVFISIALILGDGLYNFIKVLIRTIAGFISMVQQNSKGMLPVSDNGSSMSATEALSFDDERRTEIFLRDQVPKSVAYGGLCCSCRDIYRHPSSDFPAAQVVLHLGRLCRGACAGLLQRLRKWPH